MQLAALWRPAQTPNQHPAKLGTAPFAERAGESSRKKPVETGLRLKLPRIVHLKKYAHEKHAENTGKVDSHSQVHRTPDSL
jgi:hypothetical protein